MVDSKLIKERMAAKGLTQSDIANELNISRTAFNQKLSNERKMTIEQMFKVAKLLGIEPDDFDIFFLSSES